jgi:magnesium-protoporphyrin IX monomethyl ester (oxidative) cyclase
MKILLIKPPAPIPKNWIGHMGRSPPSGLAYIAAMLEKNNHDVSFLDASIEDWDKIHKFDKEKFYIGMSFDKITEFVKNANPDLVGITGLTVEARTMYRTAEAVKKAKNVPIILGGPHVCVRQEESLSVPNVDFIIFGEGEYTIIELVAELEKQTPRFDQIKGLGYKENGKLMINPRRPLIQNLDELPFPALHLFNLRKYKEAGEALQASRHSTKTGFTVITSRGCPFNCLFCSIALSTGNEFRGRSPENVVDEIEILVKKYGAERISFEDDNLTFDRKRMDKILDLIKERGLKFEWNTPNGVRADRLDEDLIKKMKETGCFELYVSPESGSQKVVDEIIGKHLDLKKVEEVVRICRKYDIEIGCFHVIGLVGETKEDLEKTYELARKLRSMGAEISCFIAQPYYGTRLYELAREKGYLLKPDGEELEYGFLCEEAMIQTPEFSPEYLYELREKIIGYDDLKRILKVIMKTPKNAFKTFMTHPYFITNYLIKRHIKIIRRWFA